LAFGSKQVVVGHNSRFGSRRHSAQRVWIRFLDPSVGGLLAGPLNPNREWAAMAKSYIGKCNTPTLRNVDQRPRADFVKAYMHNGYREALLTRKPGDGGEKATPPRKKLDSIRSISSRPRTSIAITSGPRRRWRSRSPSASYGAAPQFRAHRTVGLVTTAAPLDTIAQAQRMSIATLRHTELRGRVRHEGLAWTVNPYVRFADPPEATTRLQGRTGRGRKSPLPRIARVAKLGAPIEESPLHWVAG
jgi:hypothetical protein